VYCRVQYWFNNNPRLVSRVGESNRFYAGVKVTPSSINIVSKGKPVVMKVSLTVPIFCRGGSRNCSIAVQIASPRKDILVACPDTLVFTAANWNGVQTVTFKTKTDTKRIGVIKVSVKVVIVPQVTVLSLLMWKNHLQIITTVNRYSINSGGRAGRCISTGDPHLRTFDGLTYDHYRIGDYVLVKSRIRDFEIHVRTHRCFRVSCNCGVVVKEGSDVMAINFCGNFYSPFVGYLSKKEPQHGTGIERGGNGRSFTLRVASGAYVTFKANPYGSSSYSDISVHIPPIDFRQTVGMCGIFDGNQGNDQSKPNGQHVGGRGSAAFTESWRLSQSKSLFFYKETVTTTTTTSVTASVDVCLPALTCSFEGKKPKPGHKLLGFPGLAQCDKKRGEKPAPEIIICPAPHGNGSKGLDPDGSTFKPVVPKWPTKSGITLQVATSKCRGKLEGSVTFLTCKKLLGVQFTVKVAAIIPQCIADIKILDNTVIAFAASMQAMRDICEEAVDGKPDNVKKEFEENVCPNECSGNGKCVKGVCVCNKGFATEDCSVVLNQVPELLHVGCGHFCDVRTSDCDRVVIRSKKLVPDRVKCKIGSSTTRAEVLNFAEVICPLQTSSDKLLSRSGGIPIARYNVHLSNDGKKFSASAMPVSIYDSRCMACDQCEGKQGKCNLKANTCLINGRCYINGEVDPTDKKCGSCNAAVSTSQFVKRNGWGSWKKWSSCTKACNGGVQKRTRVCLNSCCTGKAEETRPCNQQSCNVDVKTGFCTSVTEEECAAIAKARNVKMIEIRNPNLYLFPRGCYHKRTNDRIYYNVVKSKKECTWKRICICKNVTKTV